MTSRPQRRLIVACVIAAVIALALSLLGLNEIVFILLYFDLFLLATFLSFILIPEAKLAEVHLIRKRNNDPERGTPHKFRNRVDSIGVYLKYAAKGSDFSRREIAITLRRILIQKSGAAPAGSFTIDGDLSKDLEQSVFPYTSPSASVPPSSPEIAESVQGEVEGAGSIFQSSLEHQTYLASIERIISKLER